jgi:hypothetical protein
LAVINVKDHNDQNPRIDGYKIAQLIKSRLDFNLIKFLEARVITHDTFLFYSKNKTLKEEDKQEILKQADFLFSISKTKLLAVIRAFKVPGLSNPPGPRFLGVKSSQDVLDAILALYDFATENDYNKSAKARIEVCMYPFIDPPKVKLPISKESLFPRGGCAVPLDEEAESVLILATWGNNEGVQSLKPIDEYIVNTQNLQIVEKKVSQKKHALYTNDKKQSEKIELPFFLQFQQVLNDLEILELAMLLREFIVHEKCPKRIEFTSDGFNLYLMELLNHEIEEIKYKSIDLTGEVFVIANKRDFERFCKTQRKDSVIYISKELIENRDYGVLNMIASLKQKTNVLYPGTTTTAHAMRVLCDAGHNAFTVGNKIFTNKQEVRIYTENANLQFENLSASKNIKNLDDIDEGIVRNAGGKAKNLIKLNELGYTIPNGYVLLNTLFKKKNWYETSEFESFLNELSGDKKYAIRSSANVEDGSKNAFAGQFATYLHTSKSEITQNIQKVLRSIETDHVKMATRSLGISRINMSVIVQEMIDSKISGVSFGADIQTHDISKVVIELSNGFADSVVDGVANARRIVFDKFTSKVVSDTNAKAVKIQDEMIVSLFQMYTKLEENLNNIQDVEWTIDKNNHIYLLQTRDLIV